MNMKMTGKRVIGVSLTAALAFSAFAGIGLASVNNRVNAAETDYHLAAEIDDGTILHCFDWKLSDIKAELPNIAKAGFTSVQTSPLQGGPKQGVWYWIYQPLGFEIKDTGLGGAEELKELCEAADEYGINVIVDVVANHLAGSNRDMLQKPFDEDAYWHNTGKMTNDSSREAVTTYDLGAYGDIKSEDPTVIKAAVDYVNTLGELGVDGIRWDAAKHIALPSENCAFWSEVTNNSMYHYGEILNTPGGDAKTIMQEYTKYMDVTDNAYGNDVLNDFKKGKAPTVDAGRTESEELNASSLVYWGESHDTYANGENTGTNGIDQNYIDRAYAVVASRADATALYLSRPLNSIPDQMMYGKKGSMHFTSPEVAAVNHFHNAAQSASAVDEYDADGEVAVVTRSGVGAVLVLGSGGDKEVTVANHGVPAGTYKDEVTGNEFTVTETEIKGKIGSSGIAVVYDSPFNFRVESSVETGTTFEDTLEVTLRAMGTTEAYYELSYDNGVYKYTDGEKITIGGPAAAGSDVVLSLKGHNEAGETVTAQYVYTKKAEKVLPKLTKGGVIFDNSAEGWSNVNVYIYDERTVKGVVVQNAKWPGVAMTDAGDGLFTYEFPDELKDSKDNSDNDLAINECKNIMVIFNNGEGGSQVPAKNGFLNAYNAVGYYDGGEQLTVVQTFEEEESQTSEPSQTSETSQESQESQASEVSQASEASQASTVSEQTSETSKKEESKTSDTSETSKNTDNGNENPIAQTSDATPFAAVAVLVAVSAAVIAVTAKKKREQ